jgi:CheY-like chemotaxis protein
VLRRRGYGGRNPVKQDRQSPFSFTGGRDPRTLNYVGSPGGRATILVVEDDRLLRTFYQSALTLAGYNVVTASDGVSALFMIEGHRPALIVLDLMLPLLSGRDVRRELLAHPALRDIPVVAVSGTDTGDLDPAHYGCILRKPVTPEALIETVERCLRRGIP